MRVLLFSGFCLLLPALMTAVNLPHNPKQPTASQEKEPAKNLLWVEAEIGFYGKDDTLKGKMSIPFFKLTLVSEKNGFQFYKELTLNEIKSIRIKKWKGAAFKNSKEGRHNFYPLEYEVVDLKGTIFLYQKNIPQINEFVFETEYGTTKLFAYYVDYWGVHGWEMTKRKAKDLETPKALKKVVSEIELNWSVSEPEKKKQKTESK